jgi:HD superfamily phosphodiesterase
LLFFSCILHDIGLSKEGNGDQRFEVDGADTAATFLREHGVEDSRVEIASRGTATAEIWRSDGDLRQRPDDLT